MKKTKVFVMTLGLLALLISNVASSATASSQSKVNVNTASLSELMTVPGIGTSKAKAIVDYRVKKPFKTVDELLEVKGIGKKLLSKILPFVTVNGSKTTPGITAKPKKG